MAPSASSRYRTSRYFRVGNTWGPMSTSYAECQTIGTGTGIVEDLSGGGGQAVDVFRTEDATRITGHCYLHHGPADVHRRRDLTREEPAQHRVERADDSVHHAHDLPW